MKKLKVASLRFAVAATVSFFLLCAFTPRRRIDVAKYDPDWVITNAPGNATVCLSAAAAKSLYSKREEAEAQYLISLADLAIAVAERERYSSLYMDSTNRQAVIIRRIEALRDAAVLPTTKKIYQDIIDLISKDAE